MTGDFGCVAISGVDANAAVLFVSCCALLFSPGDGDEASLNPGDVLLEDGGGDDDDDADDIDDVVAPPPLTVAATAAGDGVAGGAGAGDDDVVASVASTKGNMAVRSCIESRGFAAGFACCVTDVVDSLAARKRAIRSYDFELNGFFKKRLVFETAYLNRLQARHHVK